MTFAVPSELFLYVAFAAGYVAGRFVRVRGPWVTRGTLATVAVLILLLGASLSSVPLGTLFASIPLALAFVAAILALTAVFALGLGRATPELAGPAQIPPEGRPLLVSAGLLASLVVGFGLGHTVAVPSATLIPFVLYVLLALVGFGLVLTRAGLRGLWIPLTAALLGSTAAAGLFWAVRLLPLSASLATAFGFGFYSFTGPLVVARLGAALGLVAFLTNFLREQLTILLAPVVGPRLRGTGLSAFGGATSMDTTLYFITRYGDPEAGSLALATGVALTLVATLVVPVVLALP